MHKAIKYHRMSLIRVCYYVIITFFLICSVSASAQYYNLNFRNYSSSNGLSQSEVQSVIEDKYGFIWIGTRYGLTRYDGKEFRTFYHSINNPKSLGENIVADIEQDSKGSLWFALYNSGLSKMNDLNFTFDNIQYDPSVPGLLTDKVTVLAIDKKDRVWVGSEIGLSIYNPHNKTFKNFTRLPAAEQENFRVSALKPDAAGNIFLGTHDFGMYIIKNGTDQISPLLGYPLTGNVNDIHIDFEGKIWIAGDRGLFILSLNENNNYTFTKAPIIFDKEVIVDLETDESHNLWMATRRHGLLIYFPKEGYVERVQENYTSARGLLSNRLTCIFKDTRGGIWVGGENGIQSFHNESQKFNIYPGLSNISNHLRGSSIYGIYEVDNDFILATSGGMLVYNRITNQFFDIQQQHEAKSEVIRFRSITREGPESWWITSDRGMFELIKSKTGYVLRRIQSLSHLPLFRKESFRNYVRVEDDLWMATTENGLIQYNTKNGTIRRYSHAQGKKDSLGDKIINILAIDKDKNLLIGHDNGLSVFYINEKRFKNYGDFRSDKKRALSSRYVYDIYDYGQTYWIGTYGGGLNALHKRSELIEYYTSAQGLGNDAIYSIVPEGDSILWLSTNKGLSRFDIARKSFQNFTQNDGLPADEFNMLSKFVNSEGEIFMATINGVVSFNPQKLSHSKYPPRIYLAKIRLNGGYLSDSITGIINRDIKMSVGFNKDLFLEFSPLIYAKSLNLSIRYKLNSQEEWKEAQAGTLLPLLKMEPGNYQLQVQLADDEISVSSDSWNLNLEVLPPYWKTVSFRISVFFLIALLSFYIIRTYIQRRLEKQRILFEREQAVEKERARISGELHDDIGGGLTAIRLLSEMNKDKSKYESSRIFFGKISASSNELIQKMNEIVWALNVNHDNLQSLIAYTRQYAVSYLDDFQIRCIVTIPENIPDMPVMGNKRRNVFLLVKEALSNIVKHAQANTVKLEIRITDRLHIEVSDNGKGIDQGEIKPGNHGLINMRKRVEHLKGIMTIENKMGTAIVIDIPLKDLSEISGI